MNDLNLAPENVGIVSVAKKPRLFGVAFGLVSKGQRFHYRTVQAVKISPTECILLPSGKMVRLAATKMVKVKP